MGWSAAPRKVPNAPTEVIMIAHAGDRLVVKGAHVGDHHRVGVITEVRHDDGTPPYVVRWLDTGREALVFPAADAHVEPPAAPASPRRE